MTTKDLFDAAYRAAQEWLRNNKNRGSSQGPAWHTSRGDKVMWPVDWVDEEGRSFRCEFTAYWSAGYHKIEVKRSETAEIVVLQFWEDQLADRKLAMVIGNRHYRLGGQGGFAGREFRVRRLSDGHEFTVHGNLWFQGVIPPQYRDRLAPSHEFIDDDYRNVPYSS